jgi:poly(A) polymerase
MLRAIRFASRLDFHIEEGTWAAMREQAADITTISRERVRDEYGKIVTGANPGKGLTLLRDSGLLLQTVPVLCELDRMPVHGPHHPLSLWDHTLRVVEGVPPILALRWAAALHDIAKPRTRTIERSGRPRFFHHEEVGSQIAREILTSLRYPKDMIDAVALLVETHMQLHSYSPEWSDGAVRRLMLRLGPLTSEAILLARSDAAGHTLGGPSYGAPKFDHLQHRIAELGHANVQELKSPLSGRDLMERYGRGPGPWIREIKDALLEEVVEGRLARDDEQAAWRIADRLVGRTA